MTDGEHQDEILRLKTHIAHVEGTTAELEAEVQRLATLACVTECMAARRERDEALAANDALVRAARSVLMDCASPHGTFKTLIKAVQDMGTVINLPHPGAALLEEHREALVRARNEGLELAAERVWATSQRGDMIIWVAGVLQRLGDDLRAMKDPPETR